MHVTDAQRHANHPRAVVQRIPAQRTLEGAGFPVRRPFPTRTLRQVDPFLLLDHMGPSDWGPGEAVGAPDHPHRGFETVTYLLEGWMQHKDSGGRRGDLGPGDVQWMTAGSGVVHSEMPHPDFLERGGVMHGFQLWVNLPAAEKMISPRYQEISAEHIPEVESADGAVKARVVAGEALGASAVIETRIPITYVHFTLQPGARHLQPVAVGHNAFIYVFAGEAMVGEVAARTGEGEAALMGDGDSVILAADMKADRPTELLLLSGPPLNEPIARYGPFVMNTQEEILQAIEDYRNGKMGTISPTVG